jgi:cell wall-associated NlpC family hydrolase
VLNEYFLLTEKGWVNKRADEAIREFHSKQKYASLAGKKSAEARKANKDAAFERPLNDSTKVVQPTIKHKPITNNHKPINTTPPDGVSQSVWDDFVRQRKAKKASITETAVQGIEREAKKANMTLNDALQEICARGWTGFKAEWVVDKQPKQSADWRDW